MLASRSRTNKGSIKSAALAERAPCIMGLPDPNPRNFWTSAKNMISLPGSSCRKPRASWFSNAEKKVVMSSRERFCSTG